MADTVNQAQLDKLKATHADHAAMLDNWRWARAVRDGQLTSAKRREAFLVKGQSESAEDFTARADLCEYSAETPKIINRVLGTVFKRTPRRENLGALEAWSEAVTRQGRPLGEFAQAAAEASLWGRWSLALLDRRALAPDAPRPLTRADAQAAGIDAPYMVLYEPEQVLDWHINEDGELSYVRLVTEHGAQEGGESLTEYREVWPDRIDLWRHWKGTETGSQRLEGPLPTQTPNFAKARRLPVAVCQFDQIDAMQARSPLTEALAAEKKAMRLESDILWDIYHAGHPWLMCWVRDELGKVGVGVTKYLKLDPGDGNLPKEEAQWLEINGAALEHAISERDKAKREVYNKIGVSGSAVKQEGSAGAVANSGAQVAYQFEVDEGNTLASVAAMAEGFERAVLELAAIDMGQDPSAFEVSYNKEDFGLQSPERMLAKATQARMLYGPAHPVTVELLNRCARVLVPNKPDEWYGKADMANAAGAYEPEVPDVEGEE